jgi:hypothetical protein
LTPELVDTVRAIHRSLSTLRTLRGNPNHVPSGPHGGEFASGSGGHGKHHAKRQRRKAKKKKRLAELKAAGHKDIKDLKVTHRGQHAEMIEGQRSDWKDLQKAHKRDRKEVARDLIKEHASLKKEQAKERKDLASEHAASHKRDQREIDKDEAHDLKHEPASEHASLKAGHQERRDERKAEYHEGLTTEMASIQGDHRQALQEHKAQAIKDYAATKENQRDELGGMKADHQTDRQSFKEGRKEERRELLNNIKDELKEEFPKRRAKGGDQGGERGIYNAGDQGIGTYSRGAVSRVRADMSAVFPRSQTHKASSAESILAHCLKRRGWTARFRDGKLSDKRRLIVLEDIRLYGRRWMRHEAEMFFGRYGDDAQNRNARAGQFDSDSHEHDDTSGLRENPSESPRAHCPLEITRAIAPGLLSPLKRWFDRARQFVRELIFAGAMALRGGQLDAAEAEQADRLADVQDGYFAGFQREITANPPRAIAGPSGQLPVPLPGKLPMSPAQVGARAEKYADSSWQGAQRIDRGTRGQNGSTRWERLVMGKPKTEHCHECPPDAALGWVPFGTLRPIGDRECENLCLCHFEYSASVEKPDIAKPGGPLRQPKHPRPKTIPVTEEDHVKQVAQELYDKLKQGMKVKVVIGVGKPNG